MSGLLISERDGRVLRLTLTRPEKRNALNLELCRALVEALQAAETDRDTGAILLDARGDDFCAGMDLVETLDPETVGHTAALHERLFTVGSRALKPLVAAVRGRALAGGAGLIANAHIAVAAEDSQFGLTEIRIGLWPYIVFRSVSLAIGERRAVELSLTGRLFGAQDALTWGLVHAVVPAEDVIPHAVGVARRLSEASPDAIRRGMDFVHRSRSMKWDDAGDLAIHLRTGALNSPDYAEGVAAFREKRAAKWPSLG